MLTKLNFNFKHERTNFWKQLKKNQSSKVNVDLTTDEIKYEFQKLFNSKLIDSKKDQEMQTQVRNIVSNNMNLIKNLNQDRITVNQLEIYEIITNLPSNKANGSTGLNNEILKLACRQHDIELNVYTKNDQVLDVICYILQFIMDKQVFPKDFNNSEMYALIKNADKSTSCQSNIRPISVSDILTNIFGKIILIKINQASAPTNKQFGFTKNASCSHAVFVLKETMQITKNLKKKTVCHCDRCQ